MSKISPISVKLEDCIIRVEAHPEEISIDEYAKTLDNPQEANKDIRERRKRNRQWGWCMVQVTVQKKLHPDIAGTEHMGCCSYENKQDFIENSGYYEDMLKEALDGANRAVYEKYCEVQDLIDDGILEII